MGISQDNWHKHCKTGDKRKPYHKKRKYELGHPAANTKIGPHPIYAGHIHSLCAGRQRDVPSLEARCGQLLLGLRVLYMQNKDYLCCLLCIHQQWASMPTDSTLPPAVRVPLCSAPGQQGGGHADSWAERDFKQKTIKQNSKETWWKEKECQNRQPSRGAVPAGKLLACTLQDQANAAEQMVMCEGARSWSSSWGKSRPRKENESLSLLS